MFPAELIHFIHLQIAEDAAGFILDEMVLFGVDRNKIVFDEHVVNGRPGYEPVADVPGCMYPFIINGNNGG